MPNDINNNYYNYGQLVQGELIGLVHGQWAECFPCKSLHNVPGQDDNKLHYFLGQ